MCSQSNSYLPILPVEILHRIFDELDAQTIVLGLGRTCQRLRAVIKSYDRYHLDLQWLSKSDFKLMCHLVDPQDVVSLTLAHVELDLDHIEHFLSLFKTRELSRLRTLKLTGIAERQLAPILQSIPLQSVTSFSSTATIDYLMQRRISRRYICSSMSIRQIRELQASFNRKRLEMILWFDKNLLQYLSIDQRMDWDQMCKILSQLPRLQTLVLDDVHRTTSVSCTPLFPQITSLTFKRLTISIDGLELILSSMPSLSHFKLIGHCDCLDGDRWEHFIEAKLPVLKKFGFYISICQTHVRTPADNELIMASYRTPFWLEKKKWFVICKCRANQPVHICLFSIPICVSSLTYTSKWTKILLSTCDLNSDNAVTMMDNVTRLQINFKSGTMVDVQLPVRISKETNFSRVFVARHQRNKCCLVSR
jgi:hypothetical protein